MKATLNCIICGNQAHARLGHIHKGKEVVLSSVCARHLVEIRLLIRDVAVGNYKGCSRNCHGEYYDWMGLAETDETPGMITAFQGEIYSPLPFEK